MEADILEFESGKAFLMAEKKQHFSIAFLGIYMGGLNGMDAAKELRGTDTDCLLVFTTTSTDHVPEGFRVRALYYLVKPFSEEKLSDLFTKIFAKLPRPESIPTTKVSDNDVRPRHRNIISAEHFTHRANIHTTVGKALAMRQSFETFTELFKKGPRFFVCDHGMIISLGHAAGSRDAAFCMTDDSRVYINQELLRPTRQALMEFLLQEKYMR